MPDVRTLNIKKYEISKYEFKTAYAYCLQYPDWKKELSSGINNLKSPAIELAERIVELKKKIERIENTVHEAVGKEENL